MILILNSFGQVKFPERIENVDPTKALLDQDQIQGTAWVVADKVARDAIDEDKRQVGMLVTWIESTIYVTKRFEGINTLDVNWTNDNNWTQFIIETDTIIYCDTANFARSVLPVDSLTFNPVITSDYFEGNMNYDDETKSLQFQNDIQDFNHNLGYELVARVYNESGTTINNGNVVRITGNFKDAGKITPNVQLAGISSVDSTMVLGMATVDIPNNDYGIVTLMGEVKGLNTTNCATDDCSIYLSYAGEYESFSPDPPLYSVNLGVVYYADNDSGRVFFNPEIPKFDPTPHTSGDTSRYNTVLTISVINQFEYLPISQTDLEDEIGFTRIGDSIRCDVAGDITVALNLSYTGNIQSDTWRKGIFINGVENNSVSRSTSSTSVGNSTVIATMDVIVGDYISFKMTNESAIRSPTINDLSFEIIFLRE